MFYFLYDDGHPIPYPCKKCNALIHWGRTPTFIMNHYYHPDGTEVCDKCRIRQQSALIANMIQPLAKKKKKRGVDDAQ
jgi:hypothetical protein